MQVPARQHPPQRPQSLEQLHRVSPSDSLHLPSPQPRPLHTPDRHISPASHAWPHSPQWLMSVERLTHEPPQSVRPGSHASVHSPLLQTSSGPHARPQLPQLEKSLSRSTHRPEHSVSSAVGMVAGSVHARFPAEYPARRACIVRDIAFVFSIAGRVGITIPAPRRMQKYGNHKKPGSYNQTNTHDYFLLQSQYNTAGKIIKSFKNRGKQRRRRC
jgi:hypothetical protein